MAAESSLDAVQNADRLYGDYLKLSQLSVLGMLNEPECTDNAIIASASPVLREGYANAVLG
jgi:hypothetical protein